MLKRLFLKLLLIASPVLALLLLYVWKDPFKVLYHYDAYFNAKDSTTTISYNADMVATRTFKQNNPKYHYNAYILGGSRSGHYRAAEWIKHLRPGASPYHFNANSENLYGIYNKLRYLDQCGADIQHVLIVVDPNLLAGTTNRKEYLTIKTPEISGQNMLAYQLTFVKAFFDREFLPAYIDYQLTGLVKPYMARYGVMHRTYIYYDARYNETIQKSLNDSLFYAHDRYYQKIKHKFFTRPARQQTAQPSIQAEQLRMLTEMRNILQKHHAEWKIIVSPLYDQLKISADDMAKLCTLFGQENVFDFSGINEITANKYNYYENSHYLPEVATRLMDSVYHANGSMAR